jgi:hypothetical protein
MDKENEAFAGGMFIGFTLTSILMVLIMAFVIVPSARSYQMNEAIEAGVGEYTVNSKTGETTFRYITNAEKKEEIKTNE